MIGRQTVKGVMSDEKWEKLAERLSRLSKLSKDQPEYPSSKSGNQKNRAEVRKFAPAVAMNSNQIPCADIVMDPNISVPLNEGSVGDQTVDARDAKALSGKLPLKNTQEATCDVASTGEPQQSVNFRLLRGQGLPGVDVVLSRESVQKVHKRMEFTLVGYFLEDRIAFPVVEHAVSVYWKKFGLLKSMMNANGFFFFKFRNQQGMMGAIEGGPWMIRNKPLFLNIWIPTMKLVKEEIKKVAVWIKFHDVPIAAYTDDGLSMIASQLGNPIMLDGVTKNMCLENWGRSSYARALVELSADQEYKKQIKVAVPVLEGEGYVTETVVIEYEWQPLRCSICCSFGHQCDKCPSQPKLVQQREQKGDKDGFVAASKKKIAKKPGFQMRTRTSRVEYRPIVKDKMDSRGTGSASGGKTRPGSGSWGKPGAGSSSWGTATTQTGNKQNGSDQGAATGKTVRIDSPKAIAGWRNNRFAVLAEEGLVEGPPKDPGYSGQLSGSEEEDEEVEEVYTETAAFMTGDTLSSRGANTPSRVVANG